MEETEQQRIEREQAQKEYQAALIKMILTILGFTAIMLVALFGIVSVSIFLKLGFLMLLMPVLAIVVAIPFGLWFIRSGVFKEFRKAAIKNSMYSSYNRQIMSEMNEAMQQGPAKEYMDKFKEQIKGELREEMKKEQEQKQQESW